MSSSVIPTPSVSESEADSAAEGASASASPLVSRPSAQLFHDTDGAVAQLHAISAVRVPDPSGSSGSFRWYFYGENKPAGSLFQGIFCYSTADFLHWRHEGNDHGLALAPGEEGTITGPDRIIERPRVLRCPSTGLYVMFLHVDGRGDYRFAHIGTAVSDNPAGPFRFREVLQYRGFESRDIGCFQDRDGTGWLLSEDRPHGTHLYRLSPDYLSIEEDVCCLRGANGGQFGPEAPILVRHGGRYFWFGSNLSGWDCNDNLVATAADPAGPWSAWTRFVPEGSKTYGSQCDAVLPLDADPWNSRRFLYVGDKWKLQDLGNSPLLLLPISLSEDGTVSLPYRGSWSGAPSLTETGPRAASRARSCAKGG